MQPLQGIRVLDLSRLLPGPAASLILGDMGAQVDKVEDPGPGDYLRMMPPLVGDTSSMFLALNRNKRSIIVDLKTPAGREVLLRLVSSYDVLLEQFRPGVLDRLGLSHATLREKNPRLIVCALTGYGQSGPLAQRAGHDINYLARGGVLGFQGPAGEAPTVPGFQLADVSGALFAVIGIFGALMERQRTGTGSVVDVAMVETAMPFALAGYGHAFGGESPRRGDETLSGGIAPYNTYRTKDGGAVSLGALEPKFWGAFCAGVGRTLDATDFVPGPHQVTLKGALRDIFAARTRDEWASFSAEHDCCLEPVLSPEDAQADPHLAARGMFFELPSPWGALRQMRTPLTPERQHQPPPRRGEHTDAILADAGYDAAAIASLREAGAVA